ncbi:hypothetical protein Pmani_020615 [Petrolisthes manimaculis]|uniref:Uncharacterized protein n=1 Tax=Petrolisthes manimaculis TaxID=1843537 RepID=A0AAE1U2V9_9EUCA|nr:hypothetical protein Pmani_020615 [Petrolisthes manimaculis]
MGPARDRQTLQAVAHTRVPVAAARLPNSADQLHSGLNFPEACQSSVYSHQSIGGVVVPRKPCSRNIHLSYLPAERKKGKTSFLSERPPWEAPRVCVSFSNGCGTIECGLHHLPITDILKLRKATFVGFTLSSRLEVVSNALSILHSSCPHSELFCC